MSPFRTTFRFTKLHCTPFKNQPAADPNPFPAQGNQALITQLNAEILRLEAENRYLNDTLRWMHDAIWELLKAQKNPQPEAGNAAASYPDRSRFPV